jgi:hypothetical protein
VPSEAAGSAGEVAGRREGGHPDQGELGRVRTGDLAGEEGGVAALRLAPDGVAVIRLRPVPSARAARTESITESAPLYPTR